MAEQALRLRAQEATGGPLNPQLRTPEQPQQGQRPAGTIPQLGQKPVPRHQRSGREFRFCIQGGCGYVRQVMVRGYWNSRNTR